MMITGKQQNLHTIILGCHLRYWAIQYCSPITDPMFSFYSNQKKQQKYEFLMFSGERGNKETLCCNVLAWMQGFIQEILMSVIRHKILNLLTEFLNSIFIKICFKAYWRWTCIKNKLAYKVSSILSYLFVPQRFYPQNPYQGSAMILFAQKWTSVKLLE